MEDRYVLSNLKKGEKISKEDIKSIRPGFGLEPKYLNKVIKKENKKQIKIGERVTWDNIE